MPKIVIIYYSRSGTGRVVAERLGQMSNWPSYEIREKNERTGLTGDIRCIIDTLARRHPPIHYEGPPPADFDHVILISPVWLRSLARPMQTFLSEHSHDIKRYSAICVLSGYGGLRAVDDMATILGGQPQFTLLLKQYEVLSGECDDALYNLTEHFSSQDISPEGSHHVIA